MAQGAQVRRHPHVREADIRSVDILAGGFPCQDVSIAGKRAGLAGARTGLWWEFVRLIDEFRPPWVVGENVVGLLSSNQGKDFETILQSLIDRGYGVAWRVFDSQYFGVAQRRRRVLIVASAGNLRCSQVLFERQGVRRDTPPSRETGQGFTAYAIRRSQTSSNGCGIDGEVTHTLGVTDHDAVAIVPEVAGTLGGGSGERGWSNDLDRSGAFIGTFTRQRTDELKEGDVASTIAARDYKSASDLIVEPIIAYKIRGGKEGGGKGFLGSTETAFTLSCFNDQYLGVRRLTPTECERLQGFPDGHTDGQADSSRYKQMGNAVTTTVLEWVGKRIQALEMD